MAVRTSVKHHHDRGAVVAMENSPKTASSSSSDVVLSSRGDSPRTAPRPATRGGGGRGDTDTTASTSRRNFRGDRRGRHRQSPHQQQQQPMRGNNDAATIINNEFIAFHALCRATRYRVHAPNCACRKVGNLYTRPLLRLYDNGEEEGVGTAAASSAEATTKKDDGNVVRRENDGTSTSNDDDDDVDDNNCSKLLSRLDLTSKTTSTIATAATAPVRGQDTITTATMELLNNLIVLPDTQSSHPKYIYVCTDTHGRAFQSDWKRCEDKLANEIFNNNNNDASLPSSPPPSSFKVSCAICLLRHRSNGFAVILSPTMSTLLPTIQAANNNARRLLDKNSTSTNNSSSSSSSGLHADHAHFLCAVELSLLRQLVAVSKSSSSTNDDDEEGVGNNIVRQIESSSSSNDNAANNCIQRQRRQRQQPSIQIKLGHHITSLLHLLAELPRSNNNDDDSNNNFKCVMLMGYNDSIVVGQQQQQQQHLSTTTNKTSSIKLDLPGGKRHLGETTLCCVQREVMEECSLFINYDWLYTRVSMQYGGSIDVDDRLEKKNDMGTVVVGGRRMTVSRRIHGRDGTPTVDRKNGKDDDAFVHVLTSKCKDCHDVFFVMTPPQHTSLP